MKTNHQLSLVLLGTTMTGIVVLLAFLRQNKKKKQNEAKQNDFNQCKTLMDFEELARRTMMPHRFYYYDYKAGQGQTYKASRDYFDRQLRIMSRVLIDVKQISLKTNIFGITYDCPIIIAPSTFHCLAHVDGEVEMARGASQANAIYTYNWMYSTMPEEKVLEIEGPKFLHIYLTTPKEILEKILPNAEKKGYRAIVVTCDHPTDRVRDNVLPLFEEAAKGIDPDLMKNLPMANMNFPDIIVKQDLSTGQVTWQNITAIKTMTNLPIIGKGILSTTDVALAIKFGLNGILVSNHGGRQVDTTPPAIECLEEIVTLVDGQIEVFLDTGIRSGTDILKALALGARAVFLGRPFLYGLACGGHNVVKRVFDILKQELTYDMASCGINSIEQINRSILYKPPTTSISPSFY